MIFDLLKDHSIGSLINSIILFAFLGYIVFKKLNLLDLLRESELRVKKDLENSDKALSAAKEELKLSQKEQSELYIELDKIKDESKEAIESFYKATQAEILQSTERLEGNALKAYRAQIAKIISELQKKTSKSVLEAAEKMLVEAFAKEPQTHRKYIGESISHIDELADLRPEYSSKCSQIAKRYATALMKFDLREMILHQLTSVKDVLEVSCDLRDFLLNPIIKNTDKIEVINEAFTGMSREVLIFISMLVENKRFEYFDEIVDELSNEIDKLHNLVRVEVTSAVELTEEEKFDLKDRLQRKMSCNVKLSYKINEDIIAGLIIRIADKVIDYSIMRVLNDLKRELI